MLKTFYYKYYYRIRFKINTFYLLSAINVSISILSIYKINIIIIKIKKEIETKIIFINISNILF